MEQEFFNPIESSSKRRNLLLGLFFDAIGMLSFSIPLIGEFSDVIWAPISGIIMMRMYKGERGKLAGVFCFIEEIIPFTDFTPSFTLMWLYTYVFLKKQ